MCPSAAPVKYRGNSMMFTALVIAHNQGYVNRRYLNRVPSASEKVGERLTMQSDHVFNDQDVSDPCSRRN